jgi:hypothetical protein
MLDSQTIKLFVEYKNSLALRLMEKERDVLILLKEIDSLKNQLKRQEDREKKILVPTINSLKQIILEHYIKGAP